MAEFSFTPVADPVTGQSHGVDERGRRTVRGTLTGSAGYAAGGDSIPGLPFQTITEIRVLAEGTPNADGRSISRNGQTVRVYDAANAEVAAATDVSGSSWLVTVHGY